MENPCELCREEGLCGAKFPCKRRDAYGRWKQKAAEIRKHTQEIMTRAKKEKENDL